METMKDILKILENEILRVKNEKWRIDQQTATRADKETRDCFELR